MQTLSPVLQQLTPLSDEQLIARILEGDVWVFELLMRRHNQRLFRVARSVMRDNNDAEDVVQETYLRAYTHLAQFERRSSVATWLTRIAFHEALRLRRRRARVTVGLGPDSWDVPDPSPPADDPIVRGELRATLTTAMDALPAGLRAVVMLRLVEGLSTRDTAESLRLSEANVKVSLHRARRLLLEALEERALPELRHQFAFDGARCDRIVADVFRRLGVRQQPTL